MRVVLSMPFSLSAVTLAACATPHNNYEQAKEALTYNSVETAKFMRDVNVKTAGRCIDVLTLAKDDKLQGEKIFEDEAVKLRRGKDAATYEKYGDVWKAYFEEHATAEDIKENKARSRKYAASHFFQRGNLKSGRDQKEYSAKRSSDISGCAIPVIKAKGMYLSSIEASSGGLK